MQDAEGEIFFLLFEMINENLREVIIGWFPSLPLSTQKFVAVAG